MARIRLSLLAPAVLGAALTLHAQQPTQQPVAQPTTHTVVRGESLWSLAKQYLGDAYLWPEIYRLNTAVIEDPHWIYPGEILKLPAGLAVARAPEAGVARRAAPSAPDATTIFDPRRYKAARRADRQSANLLASHYAVRAGYYLEAPFVWAVGGPTGGGRVLSTAESQIIEPKIEQRVYQSLETIFFRFPSGAKRADGQRFMTYELGPEIAGQGQMVIVTGVIEMKDDPGSGDARAVIVQRFRQILDGQGVTAIDSLIPQRDVHPAPVAAGAATRLVWMLDEPVIAQMGSYVALSSSLRDGVRTGDQVTIFAPLGQGERGEQRTPEVAAVLQVLRVTPYGASAIILRRWNADIGTGMPGRISAKMP